MKHPVRNSCSRCLYVLLAIFISACDGSPGDVTYEPGDEDTSTNNDAGYSGEETTAINSQAVVLTQAGSTDSDGRITSAGANNGVAYDPDNANGATFLYSAEQLEAAKNRIVNRWSALEEQGLVIASISIDSAINRVVVKIGESTSMPEAEIQSVLGNEAVYQYGPDMLMKKNLRFLDTFPASGGSSISNASGRCTSGFMWARRVDNRDNFITAAHCTEVGGEFDNGGLPYAKTYISSFDSGVEGDWAYADTWASGTGGLPHIYVEDNLYRAVQYYWDISQLNKSVCFAGATTGVEKCGYVVSNENMCLRIALSANNTTLICGLSSARGYGQLASQPGDSGGPVYTLETNGNVAAAGIVTGTSIDGTELIYTPVSVIMKGLGGAPWTCTAAGSC